MTTTAPDGITIPSPLISAIDVSAWQGVIDWPAVAASGVRVAFVKASEGANGEHSRDARFAGNALGAAGVGLTVVPYHFFTAADPTEQAANFLDAFEAGPPRGVVAMLDLERSGSPGSDLGARALAWLRIVEDALGCRPWAYCSPFFALGEHFDRHPELAAYPLLLALWRHDPPAVVPAPWTTWTGWQSGKGAVPGVHGACDVDVLRCMP